MVSKGIVVLKPANDGMMSHKRHVVDAIQAKANLVEAL